MPGQRAQEGTLRRREGRRPARLRGRQPAYADAGSQIFARLTAQVLLASREKGFIFF